MIRKLIAVSMLLGSFAIPAAWAQDGNEAAADAAAASAPVGPARVLTINRTALVAVSDMGQDVVRQAKQIEDQLKADTQVKLQEFAALEEELKQKQEILSPEKFQAEVQAYARQRAEAERAMKIEAARLQRGLLVAQDKVFGAAAPIFAEIMQARGANMLIDATTVIASVQGQDITKVVVDRLNATGDRVTLVLPEVQIGDNQEGGAQ